MRLRPIVDHPYTTAYAGIDPQRALCTYAYVDAPHCGKPKADHAFDGRGVDIR